MSKNVKSAIQSIENSSDQENNGTNPPKNPRQGFIGDLNGQINMLQESLKNYAKTIETYRQTIKNKDQSIKKLNDKLKNVEEELSTSKNQYQNMLQESLKNNSQKIEDYEQTIKSKVGQYKRLEEELLAYKSECEQKFKIQENTKEYIQKIKQAHEEELAKAHRSIDTLQAQMKKIHSQITIQKEEALKKLNQACEIIENEKKKNQILNQEIKEIQFLNSGMKNSIQQLNLQGLEISKENDKLKSEINKSNKKFQLFIEKISQLQGQKQQINKQNKFKDEQILELKEKMKQINLKQNNMVPNKQFDEVKQKCTRLEKQIIEMRQSLSRETKQKERIIEDLNEQINNMKIENQYLVNKIEQQQNKIKEQQDRIISQSMSSKLLQNKIQQLQLQIGELSQRNKQLNEKIEKMEKENVIISCPILVDDLINNQKSVQVEIIQCDAGVQHESDEESEELSSNYVVRKGLNNFAHNSQQHNVVQPETQKVPQNSLIKEAIPRSVKLSLENVNKFIEYYFSKLNNSQSKFKAMLKVRETLQSIST